MNVEAFDILKRNDKLAFYGVPTEGGEYTFHRMRGFTTLSTSKNPKEYSRRYVDEESERTDIVGYSPSLSFNFDRAKDNAVHDDIISVYDGEKLGADAVRPIIIVDTTKEGDNAVYRTFSIIPESEGDGTDAYTYSGTFRSAGEKQIGVATPDDNWMTITFAKSE